jgi:GntR family transcriptional regulator
MILTVDSESGTPPYVQVREQLSRMIGSGVLTAGARLPTIHQLATDLELAPGTVARAYKELERDGLVVSQRRRGTTVADRPPVRAVGEIKTELDALAEQFALGVHQLGASPDDALDRARRAFERDVGRS